MVLVTKPKRPTPIQHKRRVGQHHRHTGHYLRPYWPYLPLALIVGIGLVASSVWGNAHKSVLGYATDMSVSALLQDTNVQRESNGLGDLSSNGQLNQAAQTKANDMATRDYWSHNTPDGATPWTFIINSGYQYQTAGENLAYGFDSSADTIAAWMNSPEHRANILGSSYKEVGFGVADSANYQGNGPETIVVAMYASPQPAVASAPVQPAAASTPASTPAPAAAPAPTAPTPTPDSNVTSAPAAAAAAVGSIKSASSSAPRTVASKNVARIQLLAGRQVPWSAIAISSAAVLCVALFLLRHALFWHRKLVKGELFIIRHHVLDIALVFVGVIGFMLTRTAGVIH